CALSVLFVPLLPAIVQVGRRGHHLARAGLAVVFLAHEASVVADAAVRTFLRMAITRKHLLRWTSAAHTQSKISEQARGFLWREMYVSPLLAVLTGVLVASVRPAALFASVPIL